MVSKYTSESLKGTAVPRTALSGTTQTAGGWLKNETWRIQAHLFRVLERIKQTIECLRIHYTALQETSTTSYTRVWLALTRMQISASYRSTIFMSSSPDMRNAASCGQACTQLGPPASLQRSHVVALCWTTVALEEASAEGKPCIFIFPYGQLLEHNPQPMQ